jgi:hypothetical protein
MVYEHVREQCIHELYNRILAHLLKSGNGGQMTTDGSMCHDFEKLVLTRGYSRAGSGNRQ